MPGVIVSSSLGMVRRIIVGKGALRASRFSDFACFFDVWLSFVGQASSLRLMAKGRLMPKPGKLTHYRFFYHRLRFAYDGTSNREFFFRRILSCCDDAFAASHPFARPWSVVGKISQGLPAQRCRRQPATRSTEATTFCRRGPPATRQSAESHAGQQHWRTGDSCQGLDAVCRPRVQRLQCPRRRTSTSASTSGTPRRKTTPSVLPIALKPGKNEVRASASRA